MNIRLRNTISTPSIDAPLIASKISSKTFNISKVRIPKIAAVSYRLILWYSSASEKNPRINWQIILLKNQFHM